MVADDTLDLLRGLCQVSGSAVEAFRACHAYFTRRMPDVGLVLLHLMASDARAVRIAGHIAAGGVEIVPGQEVGERLLRLARHDDALAEIVAAGAGPRVIDLPPILRGTPLAAALLAPAALLVLPTTAATAERDQGAFRLLLTSTLRHRFDTADREAMAREAEIVFAILERRFNQRVVLRQQREMADLADIQRLLQPECPAIRGLEFATHWQPAETAAGDYYDLMSLSHVIDDFVDSGSDAFGALLGDVSGHGAGAAMEAVQLDAILRTYRGDEPPGGPAGALNYANRHFFSRRERAYFMTVFGVSGRPDRDELVYVCAGHPPALHRRDRVLTWLGVGDDGGIPLGIDRDYRWQSWTMSWLPGDALVLYTDGIVEARDQRGRMFGSERLAQLVADGSSAPQEVLARVREAVVDHQSAVSGDDDQTLIVLRRAPAAGAARGAS